MHDVVQGDGGAFTAKRYRARRDSMTRPCVRPLAPLHPAQAAIRIANGEINGRRVVIAGREHLIKGSTYEETATWQEQKNTDNARITETHAVTRKVPMVVTVGVEDDDAGTVRLYKGDRGLATLMGNEGTAENLLTAVTESAPPKYRLDMDADTARWLAELQRADGRALPGQAPGLLPMQRHIVAAIIRSLTTYDEAWGGVPRTAFLAADMGTGKCLAPDTYIPTDQGLVTIESLMPPRTEEDTFAPLTITIQSTDGPRPTSHFYNSGLKPTKKLVTRCGYEVTGTHVHPVLVLDASGQRQWRSLAELQPDDFVAVQRHGQVWGSTTELPPYDPNTKRRFHNRPALIQVPSHLTEEVAYMLGLLVGDGCMRHPYSVGFTSADSTLAEAMKTMIKPFGLSLAWKAKRPCDYRIHNIRFKEWLNHLGFMNVTAHHKEIPPCILQAPQAIIKAFLQGLFDTDGSALKTGAVEFCSASKRLAYQVHLLLLQFGIIGARRFKANNKAGAWIITLNGAEAKAFYTRIGFRLERKQQLAARLPDRSNSNIDVIPHLPPIHFTKVPRAFGMYLRRKQAPGYAKLREMAAVYPELQDLTAPPFFWDRVTSVEDAGLQPCYDLSVPERHAFVSNGIVSHNTSMGTAIAHVLHRQWQNATGITSFMNDVTLDDSQA